MTIARRYILYTFIIVFVLGSIITPVEIVGTYRREVERISEEIHQIEHTHIPSLVSSLWLTHYDLLQRQVESIAEFPYIDKVEVVNDEGTHFTGTAAPAESAGAEGADALAVHKETLTYTYKDEAVYVGEISIYINIARMRADVFARKVPLLLYQLLSSVIVAAAISFLFHRMAGRHLIEFARFMINDDEISLGTPFELNRKRVSEDELASLVSSVNTMRARLRRRLQEKDLLLREVHHRIKNNMATVVSLLNLQSSNTAGTEASQIIDDAVNRVQTMSVLYEKLYEKGASNEMSAAEYIQPLIDEIFSVQSTSRNIELQSRFDDIVLDAGRLSTLGILINELLTNSIKHAFPDDRAGEINLELRLTDDRSIELEYRDDGIGIPQSVISGKRSGLGMVLIQSLAEQLGGTVFIQGDAGTSILFMFPLP